MVPVVVVDAAGQVAGPLAQVEHSVMLSQLSMRLQIPFIESKVKSEQPLMSLHAVWQSHSESRMAVVKMFPTHLPLSKQSVQSETKMSAIPSHVQIRALNLVVLISSQNWQNRDLTLCCHQMWDSEERKGHEDWCCSCDRHHESGRIALPRYRLQRFDSMLL